MFTVMLLTGRLAKTDWQAHIETQTNMQTNENINSVGGGNDNNK